MMEGLRLRTENGLVLALDHEFLPHALKLVEQTKPMKPVVGYKIGGATLCAEYSMGEVTPQVRGNSNWDQVVIYDHQKAGDIHRINSRLFKRASRLNYEGIIFFFRSANSVASLMGEASSAPQSTKIIVGSELTEDEDLKGHEKIYRMAAELGITDFVLPNKPQKLRHFKRLFKNADSCNFYFPGISKPKDIEGVLAVFEEGVFPIIGEKVYLAEDPLAAVQEFARALT